MQIHTRCRSPSRQPGRSNGSAFRRRSTRSRRRRRTSPRRRSRIVPGPAYWAAMDDVLRLGSLPVPNHLRSATWREKRDFGTGKGYVYPHDYMGADVEQQYLPDRLAGSSYYEPSDHGYEKVIGDRMDVRRAAREAANEAGGPRARSDCPSEVGCHEGRRQRDGPARGAQAFDSVAAEARGVSRRLTRLVEGERDHLHHDDQRATARSACRTAARPRSGCGACPRPRRRTRSRPAASRLPGFVRTPVRVAGTFRATRSSSSAAAAGCSSTMSSAMISAASSWLCGRRRAAARSDADRVPGRLRADGAANSLAHRRGVYSGSRIASRNIEFRRLNLEGEPLDCRDRRLSGCRCRGRRCPGPGARDLARAAHPTVGEPWRLSAGNARVAAAHGRAGECPARRADPARAGRARPAALLSSDAPPSPCSASVSSGSIRSRTRAVSRASPLRCSTRAAPASSSRAFTRGRRRASI